ncbi:GLPGLI family protein [Leeuwenhoekiella polynyae]|uniref:GLPGLI family protein n=1 Tax=Leeuwenhoekiella polynyae TaxID=1550906 RepID=A0A4Q0NQJ5_9FLAO|nr:GLPGLI family protein [Leeuwenhoekiella polynyae]RXG12832.1 GLPGLI family protein [Leeuwenhoekiella polynyae]
MRLYTYSFFLITFLISSLGFSQNKLKGKLEYKVTYKLSFQLDSTDADSRKSELMILYLGEDFSKYLSRAKILANPIVREGNSGHTARSATTNFHYEIIKQRDQDSLLYLLKFPEGDDRFVYEESKHQFNWKIEQDTKTIEGFSVQKATTAFAGRKYTAWFTTEIPIADGPYKFNGLPGLILEISDSQNYWNFEFVGLEKLSPKINYQLNLKQYAETTREDLEKTWYRYRSDPMGYGGGIPENITISAEVHQKYRESFAKMLEAENNPIELKSFEKKP